MAMTKADVINFIPQILEAGIVLGVPKYFDFWKDNLLTVYNRPDMQPGRTLDLPTRGTFGLLQEKAEGADMAEDSFSTGKIQVTPIVRALKVSFTLEAGGGYNGNLAQDIEDGLTLSLAKTLDQSVFDRIKSVSAAGDIDKSANTINTDDLSEVMASMQMRDPSTFTLFVSYNQLHQLRTLKDANGNSVWAPINLADAQTTGQIGTVYGIKVVPSEKIVADTGVVDTYIVEDGAVGLVWANRNVHLDSEIDKSKLIYWTFLDSVYETFLMPNLKVQRVKFKEV